MIHPRLWTARNQATGLGVLAIVMWSTSAAAAVTMVRHLGLWTALTAVTGIAGLLLAVVEGVRRRQATACLRIGWRFAVVCGGFFVTYQVCFYWAFSQATDSVMALQLNLVNYLWPSFIVLGAYRGRGHPLLLSLAVLLGFAGIVIAISPDPTLGMLVNAMIAAPFAFLAMLVAAASWAIFSLLVGKFERGDAPSGTALFFLATAVVAGCIRTQTAESSHWDASIIPQLAYTAMIPTALGYILWERSVRDGDVVLLGSLSNSLPLLSTLIGGVLLGVALSISLVFGAVLVVAGAVLAHKAARPITVNA